MIKKLPSIDALNQPPNPILIWELDGNCLSSPVAYGEDIHIILHTLHGKAELRIDGQPVYGEPNYIVDQCIHRFSSLEALSKDYRGYIIILKRSYVTSTNPYPAPFSFEYMSKNAVDPRIPVSDQQQLNLIKRLEDLNSVINDLEPCFSVRLMTTHAMMLYVLTLSAYANPPEDQQTVIEKKLLQSFMDLMTEHIDREHSVIFYADKLCITPQYLNRISQKAIGETAKTLINKRLVGKISLDLRMSPLNIQEIAWKYGFGENSSLTRYLRRYLGVSPSEYRTNNCL